MATVHVDADNLLKQLNDIVTQQLPEDTRKAVEKACLFIEGESKRNVPVGDGVLRASITHGIDAVSDGVEGYVGAPLEYAPYVHQGTGLYAVEGHGRQEVPWKYQDVQGNWHSTSGMKPIPFIQMTIEQHRQKIMNFLSEVLKGK
jgi:HK97 gp10 family phage protein